MADTKISDLTAATSVDDADLMPIVQSATTKKATWSLVRGTTSKVSSSDFTTSSTTLVDITGLSFAAAANKTYEVEVTLAGKSSDASGVKAAIAYSGTAGSNTQYIIFTGTSLTAASTLGQTLGTQTSASFWTGAGGYQPAKLYSVIVTSTTGNITVQISKTTSGTATVYIGSRMTVTLLA